MDHAIEKVRMYYEFELEALYEEWSSKKYEKLSDCPSFKRCNAYRKAIKIMDDYYYEKKSRGSVKEDLQSYMAFYKGVKIHC